MKEVLLTSSVLILAVFLVRVLFQKAISRRLQYALWGVVLIRLLLPLQLFTSVFGTGTIAQNVDISSPVRQVYTAARSEAFETDYESAYRQIEAEYAALDRGIAPDAIEKEAYTRVRQEQELEFQQELHLVLLQVLPVQKCRKSKLPWTYTLPRRAAEQQDVLLS